MTVEVIQYLRPNGRRSSVTTELPDNYRPAYEKMRKRGWNFSAEVLLTDEVSVAIEDPIEEVDRNIKVVSNGPMVQAALQDMLDETFGAGASDVKVGPI